MKRLLDAAPHGGQNNCKICFALRIIAYGLFAYAVFGFIFALEVGFIAAIAALVGSIVPGIIMLGFSKIIELLQLQQTQQYAIYVEDDDLAELITKPHAAPNRSTGPRQQEARDTDQTTSANEVRMVHLSKRTGDDFLCPLCHEKQRPDRNCCWSCGVKFVFDDDNPALE